MTPSYYYFPLIRHNLHLHGPYLTLDVNAPPKPGLHLDETECVVPQEKRCPRQDLSITTDDTEVMSTGEARKLSVTQHDKLSVSANIEAVACYCKFLLYNISSNICPFHTKDATQTLIQACHKLLHLIQLMDG